MLQSTRADRFRVWLESPKKVVECALWFAIGELLNVIEPALFYDETFDVPVCLNLHEVDALYQLGWLNPSVHSILFDSSARTKSGKEISRRML